MSTIFVAISIVGMTVNTLEGLQYEVQSKWYSWNSLRNCSGYLWQPTRESYFGLHWDNMHCLVHTWVHAKVDISFFRFNINSDIIRLAGAPEKIKFLKDAMNIIDVLSIMPFFLTLFFLDDQNRFLLSSVFVIWTHNFKFRCVWTTNKGARWWGIFRGCSTDLQNFQASQSSEAR